MTYLRLLPTICFLLLFSCSNSINKQELKYASVSLFTIDQSIYTALDTVTTFPDGTQAYKWFLGGQSFIDSLGQPIHERFTKYMLTKEEDQKLKESFLYELCDYTTYSCMTTYRDVLVFYDSANNVVQQAQICFSCGEASIYPFRDFMCKDESTLDFKVLKEFVNSIKK